MTVKIITNHHPRFIEDWIPVKYQEEFDYIDWQKVEDGNESVSFVFYRGEYFDVNQSDGVFPHNRDWWYQSVTFGFGYLFKLVEVDGEDMIVCGTYIIS